MINDEALASIEKLHKMKQDGIISDDDFEAAKRSVLQGSSTPARRAVATSIDTEAVGLPSSQDHVAWATLALRKYADFSGRSCRKEFWMFQLLFVALSIVGGILTVPLGDDGGLAVVLLGVLALTVPMIAVEVRRLHDQDRSGWFVLLNLIPYIGWLLVWGLMLIEGTRGDNQYGVDPLGA